MNTFPWNIFFVLLAGGIFGTIAVLPYSLAINPIDLLKNKPEGEKSTKKTPTMPVIIMASVIQGGVLMAIAAFLGLLAAGKTGLDLPIIRAVVNGEPFFDTLVDILPIVFLTGLLTGVVMLVLEKFVFQPRLPKALSTTDGKVSLWKRALVCFYGGIDEEILIRLFIMSGLSFLFGLLWKDSSGFPTLGAFWLANFLSAILFGLGHLPATKRITPLTGVVVGRALLLNGIPGLVFGYLFMQYGLEAAMLTHFLLDIIIHVAAPRFLGAPSEPVEALAEAE